MADGGKGSLEIWLDFAKALVWPVFILLALLIFGRPLKTQLVTMVDALEHSGGQLSIGPSGVNISLLAQAQQAIRSQITNESKPDSPSDPAPSAQAISQVQALKSLQTLAPNGGVSTKYGWIYCGPFVQGHWTKPPNLKVKGPILQNQTYGVSTDTYLRESPPQGDAPKGQVTGIVPQGQQVKVLEVRQIPDKDQPGSDASLIWVRIENKEFYGMKKN
jgi:hypothetical protein